MDRENAQQAANWKLRQVQRFAGSTSEEAMLLIRPGNDEVIERPARQTVTYEAISIVGGLSLRAQVSRQCHPTGVRRDLPRQRAMADNRSQNRKRHVPQTPRLTIVRSLNTNTPARTSVTP
jgi:hypothetical protein